MRYQTSGHRRARSGLLVSEVASSETRMRQHVFGLAIGVSEVVARCTVSRHRRACRHSLVRDYYHPNLCMRLTKRQLCNSTITKNHKIITRIKRQNNFACKLKRTTFVLFVKKGAPLSVFFTHKKLLLLTCT